MAIDDSIKIVEEARKREALDRLCDEIGKYMVEQFYSMSDPKSKGKYKLDLNSIEKADMETYLLANFKIEAKKLILKYNLKKEDILKGKASLEVYKQLSILKAELMSVEQEKKKTEQDLKTKKKQQDRNRKIQKILAAIAVAGSIAITGALVSDLAVEVKEDREVDQAIGAIVSELDNDKRDIVVQNEYIVGFDAEGFPIVAYNNEGIAKDIIKLCTSNPELFDICIYNAYDNMNHNRLENMDDVIKYLKIYTKDVAGLESIYAKVDNCAVFLDYIVNRGFLNPNAKEYYVTLNDIEIYKGLKSDNSVAYNGLPEESRERIDGLIKNYRQNKDNLYNEYKDDLEGLGDTHGSRS